MQQIILTEEQAKVAAVTRKPLAECDGAGRILGTIAPIWTEEDIADAKRRLASNEPRYTTEQVLAHRLSLESK